MSDWDFSSFWDEALRQIKEEFEQAGRIQEFSLWFSIDYESSTETVITASVPSAFLRDQAIKKGYVQQIEHKILELSGKEMTLDFIIKPRVPRQSAQPVVQNTEQNNQSTTIEKSENNSQQSAPKNIVKNPIQNLSIFTELQQHAVSLSEKKEEEPALQIPVQSEVKKNTGLREDYTFDTFIPGENNRLAFNAAVAIASNPGRSYNPVLFYGGVGLGKTHLMEAIGNEVYKKSQGKLKVIYISAENFTNEFVQAIKAGTDTRDKNAMVKFKTKYRNADVLLIDDIHFLQNKEETQEELFHTFNALYDSYKQLVFTCDRPISELKNVTARLKSRFERGLSVDMQPPAYETRRAILEKKLVIMNRSLPDNIIELIAQNVATNVRDLEASLTKLIAYMDLTEPANKKITVEKAQQLLRDTFRSPISENITVETIQRVVAESYNISYTDMKSKKKTRNIAFPRQIAMYIAREMTDLSTTDLGMEFGGRDHTTVMHACNLIKGQIRDDTTLNYKIQQLMQEIKMYKKS